LEPAGSLPADRKAPIIRKEDIEGGAVRAVTTVRSQDRRRKAKAAAKAEQGDRGDRARAKRGSAPRKALANPP